MLYCLLRVVQNWNQALFLHMFGYGNSRLVAQGEVDVRKLYERSLQLNQRIGISSDGSSEGSGGVSLTTTPLKRG